MPSVIIRDIKITKPDCPPAEALGSIAISASNEGGKPQEYSIDGGITWTSNPVFTQLKPGTYHIKVRILKDPKSETDGGERQIPPPDCPNTCLDTDDPCATTLFPGDLSILGFDNWISKKGVRLVVSTQVRLRPRSWFSIAHTVYESGAVGGQHTDRWYDGMGNNGGNIASQKILYKGEQTISAGSVICFDLPQTGTGSQLLANNFMLNGQPSKDFCAFNNGLAGDPLIEFHTKLPSAIFLLQGDWTHLYKYSTLCGRVLCGLQDGDAWIFPEEPVPTDSRRSRLHPHIACFAEQTSLTPMPYAAYFPAFGTYTPLGFLEQVMDFHNWILPTSTQDDDVTKRGCGVKFEVVNPK